LLLGDRKVVERIAVLDQTGIATSVIVRGELQFMAWKSENVEENLQAVNEFLRNISAYHVDYAVAQTYASLKAWVFNRFGPKDRAKRRRTSIQELGFSDNDLWIAATAIRFNLIVVTSDSNFARIAQVTALRHESWLSSAPST